MQSTSISKSNSYRKSKKSKWNLSAFDMFGSPVSFNIRGDSSYQTVIGCFWSLAVLAVIGASFTWYFISFLDTTNVEVNSRTIMMDEYPKIDFKENDFFFSLIAIRDRKIVNLDGLKDVLEFDGLQYSISSETIDGERTNFNIESPTVFEISKCAENGRLAEVNGEKLEGKNNLAVSDSAICTFPNNPTSGDPVSGMYAEGDEDTDHFSYLRLRIKPCSDPTPACLNYYLSSTSGTDQFSRFSTP